MNCQQAHEQIGIYLDGELLTQSHDLEQHIEQCDACVIRNIAPASGGPLGISAAYRTGACRVAGERKRCVVDAEEVTSRWNDRAIRYDAARNAVRSNDRVAIPGAIRHRGGYCMISIRCVHDFNELVVGAAWSSHAELAYHKASSRNLCFSARPTRRKNSHSTRRARGTEGQSWREPATSRRAPMPFPGARRRPTTE